MEKIEYFDNPTRVMYVDEEGEWRSGIAYCGEIICGCCGGIQEIDDIYENAPENVQFPIHPYSNWNDIAIEIMGGELPLTLKEVLDTETGKTEIKENI